MQLALSLSSGFVLALAAACTTVELDVAVQTAPDRPAGFVASPNRSEAMPISAPPRPFEQAAEVGPNGSGSSMSPAPADAIARRLRSASTSGPDPIGDYGRCEANIRPKDRPPLDSTFQIGTGGSLSNPKDIVIKVVAGTDDDGGDAVLTIARAGGESPLSLLTNATYDITITGLALAVFPEDVEVKISRVGSLTVHDLDKNLADTPEFRSMVDILPRYDPEGGVYTLVVRQGFWQLDLRFTELE